MCGDLISVDGWGADHYIQMLILTLRCMDIGSGIEDDFFNLIPSDRYQMWETDLKKFKAKTVYVRKYVPVPGSVCLSSNKPMVRVEMYLLFSCRNMSWLSSREHFLRGCAGVVGGWWGVGVQYRWPHSVWSKASAFSGTRIPSCTTHFTIVERLCFFYCRRYKRNRFFILTTQV